MGLGSLLFEHPDDAAAGKLRDRAHDNVNADRLGKELRHAGVGLFFLEACESAMSEENPEASVAGRLLQSGVASVAAMSHSVLVETARRFTEAFYPALARGERVGAAMLVHSPSARGCPSRRSTRSSDAAASCSLRSGCWSNRGSAISSCEAKAVRERRRLPASSRAGKYRLRASDRDGATRQRTETCRHAGGSNTNHRGGKG